MISQSLAANPVCAKAKEAPINTRANQRSTRRSMLALLYRKSNRSQCAAPRCPPLPFDKGRGLTVRGLKPLSAIAVSPAKKFPKCCVWRVTNAEAPFYLVGSIHALSKKDYPLPSAYDRALKDSTRFVFEFDPNRGAEFERKFEAAAKYPPGQDIRSKIDPALLAWLRQNILALQPGPRRGKRARVAGFDSELRYKPWWIAQ